MWLKNIKKSIVLEHRGSLFFFLDASGLFWLIRMDFSQRALIRCFLKCNFLFVLIHLWKGVSDHLSFSGNECIRSSCIPLAGCIFWWKECFFKYSVRAWFQIWNATKPVVWLLMFAFLLLFHCSLPHKDFYCLILVFTASVSVGCTVRISAICGYSMPWK